MKGIFSTVFLLFLCNAAFAEGSNLITFKDAERIAIKNSPQIVSQRYTTDSAYQTASSQKLKRLPTLNLNAQSSLSSKIAQIEIPSAGISQTVGEHLNWSISPTLNFIVWDTGQILNRAKSLKRTADAQSNILDYDKREVLLGARTAYIGVQLAKEQVRLVKDALALARSQYAYVHEKFKVGASDKFDLTVAHQEMSDREKDLEQALGELYVSKRSLAASLGIEQDIETAENLDTEPLNVSLGLLLPRSNTPFNPETHPQVKALENKKSSYELSAKSVVAKYFPEISLTGVAGYQYPNLGQDEIIQQNSLMMGLQMPILEWGSIWKETKSQKYKARSAHEEKRQTVIDLTKDVSETRDWIDTYKRLRTTDVRVVGDAVEVAKLSYDSFKAGKIIFLDVQRANVKALSAKVDAARDNASLAVQISKLLALAVDEEVENDQE